MFSERSLPWMILVQPQKGTSEPPDREKVKRSISSKSRRVEFRGESLECQFDQMKTMLHKDRVSTLFDVAERA